MLDQIRRDSGKKTVLLAIDELNKAGTLAVGIMDLCSNLLTPTDPITKHPDIFFIASALDSDSIRCFRSGSQRGVKVFLLPF